MKLAVSDLNSHYGPAHILFDIALEVGEGEVVALLGRNGAGKSTTFRSIVGLVELRSGRIAVGQIFLPRTDYGAQETCRTIVEAEILRGGFYIYGWRQVPVDISIIGEKANATRPEIEQIMFDAGDVEDFETLDRRLYLCRRRIEKKVREASKAIARIVRS